MEKPEKTLKKALGKDGYELVLAFLCESLKYLTGGQAKPIETITVKYNGGFISKLNTKTLEIEHVE